MCKKIFCLALIFSLFAAAGGFAEKNLLENPGFEQDYLGNIANWDIDAYSNSPDAVRATATEEVSHSGKRALIIVNIEPNDTKAIQWVKVEPDTYYKISCWVMAEDVSNEGMGANISVLGNIIGSRDLKATGGKWELISLVGMTGPKQEFLPVTVRLGFYSNLCTGRAYFDDVKLEKLTRAPVGMVIDFSSQEGVKTAETGKGETPGPEEGSPGLFVLLVVLGVCLIVGGGLVLLYVLKKRLRTAAHPAAAGKKSSGTAEGKQKGPKKQTAKSAAGKVERRKAVRKNKRLTVTLNKKLRRGGSEKIELKSKNISLHGIFLQAEDLSLFKVGEELSLTIQYKRRPLEIGPTQVVRKHEVFDIKGKSITSGFGLAFVSKKKEHRANIKRILG